MTETKPLANYLQQLVAANEEQTAEFIHHFRPFHTKRRQLIIQPGFVAKHRFFVLKGALRAYVIGDEGQEHTIQLAIENWWISDYNSYINQQPATMFVMAMEDCELLQISYEDERKLKQSAHQFETFFRIVAERSTAFMQRRIIASLTQSAEERYNHFLEKYPLLNERMPQYVVASYLGMSTEFLSKIRNNKVPRKS